MIVWRFKNGQKLPCQWSTVTKDGEPVVMSGAVRAGKNITITLMPKDRTKYVAFAMKSKGPALITMANGNHMVHLANWHLTAKFAATWD